MFSGESYGSATVDSDSNGDTILLNNNTKVNDNKLHKVSYCYFYYSFSFEATIKQENPNLVNNTTSRVLTYFQVYFHTISVYVRLSKG